MRKDILKKLACLICGMLFAVAASAQGATAQDDGIIVNVMVRGQVFSFRPVAGSNCFMGATEVTQSQYEAVTGENPSRFKGGSLPVEQVSWYDAIYFCNKLSMLAGYSPIYAVDGETDVAKWNYVPNKGNRIDGKITQDLDAAGFRLPTDDEWEYAAWGGQSYRFSGSDSIDDVGWYAGNSGHTTHPVAQKKANGYGLYDMSGNVWEWVWDPWANNLSKRYFRGGSWYYISIHSSLASRFSSRTYYYASRQVDFIGFRILLSAGGQ